MVAVLASVLVAQFIACFVVYESNGLLSLSARWWIWIAVLLGLRYVYESRAERTQAITRMRSYTQLGPVMAAAVATVGLWTTPGVDTARMLLIAPIWLPLLAIATWPRWRSKWREAIVLALSSAVATGLFFWVGDRLVATQVAPQYRLDVDHRPRPLVDGANEDGLYTTLAPAELGRDDTVILVVGDSFVANPTLPAAARWPRVMEARLRTLTGRDNLYCINAGWVSSSPVLQARMLRDVGAKYSPDLIVQCLDMSDVHDDWRAEIALRAAGQSPGVTRLGITRVLSAVVGSTLGVGDLTLWRRGQLRGQWRQGEGEGEGEGDAAQTAVPAGRYFHLGQPAFFSRDAYERTWRALLDTRAAASQTDAEYLLVLLPRYQQYDPREAPDDWEKGQWPEKLTHLREPLEWFGERARTEGIPCLSLLPAFEGSGRFPTCFDDDPHWNETGNQIAADAVAAEVARSRALQSLSAP